MESLSAFLCSISEKGVNLWIEGDRIHYSAPGGMSSWDLSVIRSRKRDIVSLLGPSGSLDSIITGPSSGAAYGPVSLSIQQRIAWGVRHSANMVCRVTLRLSGPLDQGVLEECLDVLLDRHSTLRTRIDVLDGEPRQEVFESNGCGMECGDLSSCPKEDRGERAAAYVEEILRCAMNPEIDRLFQLHLLRVTERQHVLVLSMHHIICDGGSIALLLQELWTLYASKISGVECEIPHEAIRYVDYVVWQQCSELFWRNKNEKYWSAVLSRAQRLVLPTDMDGDGREVHPAGSIEILLGDDRSERMRELARSMKLSPAIVMLAVCVEALSRWCEQDNVGVCSIVSGRDFSGLANVVGFFAMPIYIYIDKSGNESFIELAGRVASEITSALEHAECGMVIPREMDWPDLGPIVTFQWGPSDPRAVAARHIVSSVANGGEMLIVESLPVRREAGYFGKAAAPLDVHFFDGVGGIYGRGYYRADLFQENSVRSFERRFASLCDSLLADPAAKLPVHGGDYRVTERSRGF